VLVPVSQPIALITSIDRDYSPTDRASTFPPKIASVEKMPMSFMSGMASVWP
jgi:hypothetical protein